MFAISRAIIHHIAYLELVINNNLKKKSVIILATGSINQQWNRYRIY